MLEVFSENELPLAPEGKKFFTCIGGKKNFQCFLSDNWMSKGQFITTHENELDDCLKPIYENNGIVVRQDAKYAIPGFYIVSPKEHFSNIHDMPATMFQRCMFIAQNVKKDYRHWEFNKRIFIMMKNTKIQLVHIFGFYLYINGLSKKITLMPLLPQKIFGSTKIYFLNIVKPNIRSENLTSG